MKIITRTTELLKDECTVNGLRAQNIFWATKFVWFLYPSVSEQCFVYIN